MSGSLHKSGSTEGPLPPDCSVIGHITRSLSRARYTRDYPTGGDNGIQYVLHTRCDSHDKILFRKEIKVKYYRFINSGHVRWDSVGSFRCYLNPITKTQRRVCISYSPDPKKLHYAVFSKLSRTRFPCHWLPFH